MEIRECQSHLGDAPDAEYQTPSLLLLLLPTEGPFRFISSIARRVSRRARSSRVHRRFESSRRLSLLSSILAGVSALLTCSASNHTLHHDRSAPEWLWWVSARRQSTRLEGVTAVPRMSRALRLPTTMDRQWMPPLVDGIITSLEFLWNSSCASPIGRRAGGKGSLPLDKDRRCRWYRFEAVVAEVVPPDPFEYGEGNFGEEVGCDEGMAIGGRIRIDSALFNRVGEVPGRSNKAARDDLEGGDDDDNEECPPETILVEGACCCESGLCGGGGSSKEASITAAFGCLLAGASSSSGSGWFCFVCGGGANNEATPVGDGVVRAGAFLCSGGGANKEAKPTGARLKAATLGAR